MLVVNLLNDAGNSGNYELRGAGKVGTLDEAFPSGPNIPVDNSLGSRTIQADQAIKFVFEWSVVGTFANSLNPAFKYEVELFFEKFGPGEFDLAAAGIPPVTVTDGSGTVVSNVPGSEERSWTAANANAPVINIPAGTIPVGVYEIVAVIRYLDTVGNPKFVAAFAGFGKVNFIANL